MNGNSQQPSVCFTRKIPLLTVLCLLPRHYQNGNCFTFLWMVGINKSREKEQKITPETSRNFDIR